MRMAKKICKALAFADKTSNAKILTACCVEWVKRNKLADGALNKNNYAPIYCTRGDEKLSVRRSGNELVLFAAIANCKLPYQTAVVWK